MESGGDGGLSPRCHNSSSSHHNHQQKSRRQVPSTTGREQGQYNSKEDFNGCVDHRKHKNKTEEEGERSNSSNNNTHRQCTQPTNVVCAPCKRSTSLSLYPFQPPAPPRDSSTHGYQPIPCRPYIHSTSTSSPSIPSSVKQQHQQRYSIISTTDNNYHNNYYHHNNYHHRHSTGNLNSVESGSHTMTTRFADWGGEHGDNGNSVGKVYIFLVLGIIFLMSGIIIGGFYLNIQQITTSSDLTEVLPTYVNALSVITIGFCVMFLFWKRWRIFLFVVMVLNIGGFLLCLLTGILTATHILKPITAISPKECEFKSRTCVCYSPYKRVHLSLVHSKNESFRLSFHGADNCLSITSSLPKMLYVLIAINLIVTLICVFSYFITYRVYRMKKKKEEDQWEEEICERDEMQHHNSTDYYLPAHCHDSYNQGPPSPGSPVPLLETVYPRGLSRVMKSSMLRDWFPDFVRKDKLRHLKRSQSFSHRSRNNIIDSSNEVFDDNVSGEVRTLGRGHSSKTSHPPRRTLSETMRPTSTGTPESKQDRRQRTMTMDNLDNRQLLLIMSLHMRNMQEQHEAEIQNMQEQQRRSKTPQPYNPGSKGGYMAGRRAYTPQPAKTQSGSPSIPTTPDGRPQLPPRRRQLFADLDEAFMPPTSTAKTFAEAMFNDMINPVSKYNAQEHIELETLPLCNIEGVGNVDVQISKLKQNNSFHVPKTSSDGYSNINQSLLVDCHKRPSLTRTLSESLPPKADSVFIVPLYEKIDSPEHDIVTSPVYERLVSSPETRTVLSHNYPERIFNQASLPYAIKISSSECLYSKSTKPKESIYGKISKKSDFCDRDSPAKRDSHQGSAKVSKEMSAPVSRKSNSSQTRNGKMATPDSSKHYIHSPDANSKTPSKLVKSDQKDSGKKYLKRQDAIDLNVTLDSVSSGYSQSQDNSNRSNISGTSTELSPPNTNHNRSNASGTSMDASPDGQQDSSNPCNTPISHPKMLPLTPDLSPTTPEDTSLSPEVQSSSHRSNASGISSLLYMPEDQNLSKSSVVPLEYSRNITGASADISPENIIHDNAIYSPPKHAGYMVLNNNSGHSTNLSSFQNLPHSPSRNAYNQNQSYLPKEYYLNNCISSNSPKQVQRCYEGEQYDSSMQSCSTSLLPQRENVEESLGPREQPYGQYGPHNRNIDGCNVYASPAKNNNIDSKHKNRLHSNSNYYANNNNNNNSSRDREPRQQPKMKPPPPPYQSHTSSSSSFSSSNSQAVPHKLHAEVRKNPARGKGNFRVGPEGISYRRKKVEGQDTSYIVESPRSELDVEGHAAKEEFYDVHEEKHRLAATHHYRNDLKNPHDIVLLRDETNGSDSDALETVI